MKKEQGITLITLIIYILLMTFILAGVSSITASFYSNTNEFDKESESAVAYSKFNMYFLTDIKRKNASIESSGRNYVIITYEDDGNSVDSGDITVEGAETRRVEYSKQNDSLYRNKVKICDNVDDAVFIADTEENTIKVEVIIGEYQRSTVYKLENVNNDVQDMPEIN